MRGAAVAAGLAVLALAGCERQAAEPAPPPGSAPASAQPVAPQAATPETGAAAARASEVPATAPLPHPAQPAGRAELDACLNSGEAAQGVTSAMAECLGAEFERQDGRLNRAYQAAMAAQDEAGKAQLRQAQRAWIRFRDQSCREGATGGTIDRLNGPSCMADRSRERADELERLAQVGR
ncbi:lysozyme inhibitor LprI family protein [Phenylobacterium deserti]|uniref:Lysozyme inhibitor LprI-like N-terminal domain-containing protein n=1 Tax=Phenylobacterium deserti TaxID=1914756 RepID=A0A328AD55_9CAUL|nr:lysozyme inhibitor LprI family protein [Phenylobacterium deserti]RAK52581.1 hypothetical protein DJ018_10240 [Phenylobacterium deserti]